MYSGARIANNIICYKSKRRLDGDAFSSAYFYSFKSSS